MHLLSLQVLKCSSVMHWVAAWKIKWWQFCTQGCWGSAPIQSKKPRCVYLFIPHYILTDIPLIVLKRSLVLTQYTRTSKVPDLRGQLCCVMGCGNEYWNSNKQWSPFCSKDRDSPSTRGWGSCTKQLRKTQTTVNESKVLDIYRSWNWLWRDWPGLN